MNGQAPAQNSARNMKVQNDQARALVLSAGVPMFQQIYANTIASPTLSPQTNLPPQNVGLIRGFLIRLVATITNPSSGSSALTLTPLGPANLLQSLIFSDLQNYQRINTAGWHLHLLNTVKQGRPFFSSTASDSPIGYGSNFSVIKAPSTIATNSSGTIDMYFWVPLAYDSQNLQGAIYANVVNATMNMQLNWATNTTAFAANTADPTFAIYQGAGAVAGCTLTNLQVTIYQDYIDQLPTNGGSVILPALDLNTMYELKNTSFTAIPQASDFYIPYSNFRHFLSTTVIFDNQTGGAYPTPGSDVNYWSFRTANTTDMRKADPYTWAAFTRRKILTDVPTPLYYFDTRQKPIFTTQQGNTNLVLNASTVNSGAVAYVGWEMLANIQQLVGASSLAS